MQSLCVLILKSWYCCEHSRLITAHLFQLVRQDNVSVPLLHGWLEDWNNGILVIGHHEDTAELVKQCLELRAPHVLIVHNLFQVMMPPEIVQQPESSQHSRQRSGLFFWIITRNKSTMRQDFHNSAKKRHRFPDCCFLQTLLSKSSQLTAG